MEEIKKYVIIVVIAVVLLLAIIKIFQSIFSKNDSITFSNSDDYKRKVYSTVPHNLQEDIRRLDALLAELRNQIQSYGDLLSQQKSDALNEISKKIEDIENKIAAYWNNQKRKQDFYYCIALHYASFTLANLIKSEQLKIRDSFVAVKKRTDSYSLEIDRLNKTIPTSKGPHRHEMMQRHSELCKQHKKLCGLKNSIGGINTKYHARLDLQNQKTADRRDYIIKSFGSRGRRWGEKLTRNKQDSA